MSCREMRLHAILAVWASFWCCQPNRRESTATRKVRFEVCLGQTIFWLVGETISYDKTSCAHTWCRNVVSLRFPVCAYLGRSPRLSSGDL